MSLSLSSNNVTGLPKGIVVTVHIGWTRAIVILLPNIMAITIYNPGSGPDNRGSAGDGGPEVGGRENHHGGLYSFAVIIVTNI